MVINIINIQQRDVYSLNVKNRMTLAIIRFTRSTFNISVHAKGMSDLSIRQIINVQLFGLDELNLSNLEQNDLNE